MDSSQQWMAFAIFVIVIIGGVGNSVSLLIFSRPHMRVSSVNVLLCALSFFDFSLLALSVPIFVIPNISIWDEEEDQEQHNTYMAYVLKILYPMNLMMQTCSVYIMVVITLERWIAVCRPLQVRVWCTPRKSKTCILGIILSAIAYNFIRFFEYEFVETEDGRTAFAKLLRDPEKHRWYYVGYYTILYILTHFLVPFSLMALANGQVICYMYKMSKTRQMLTRQQKREQSTTVMLLIVTFTFAFCNTLPFILNVVESTVPTFFSDKRTSQLAFWMNDLSNLLVILNSATTFIIYFIFSEKYRQTLFFIMKNGCCKSKSDFATYTTMSRTASMRISSENQIQRQGSKMSTCSRQSDVLLKPMYSLNNNGTAVHIRRSWDYTGHGIHLSANNDAKLPRLPSERKFKTQRRSLLQRLSPPTDKKTPEITITVTEDPSNH